MFPVNSESQRRGLQEEFCDSGPRFVPPPGPYSCHRGYTVFVCSIFVPFLRFFINPLAPKSAAQNQNSGVSLDCEQSYFSLG